MSSERRSSVAASHTSTATTVLPLSPPEPPAAHLRRELPPPLLPGPAVPAGGSAINGRAPRHAAPFDAPALPTTTNGVPAAANGRAPRHGAPFDAPALPTNTNGVPAAANGRAPRRADSDGPPALPVPSVPSGRAARHAATATAPVRSPRHGARTASPGPRGTRHRRLPTDSWPFWVELPVLLFVAFAFAFVIKTFVVQPFFIPSGSMEDTLHVYDRVLVNKLVFHTRPIERGDIVVFDGADSFTPEVSIAAPTNPVAKVASWLGSLVGFAPPDENDFIKRVVGVGGDHVKCCDAQGRVTVNGIALDEHSYLFPGDDPSDQPFDVVVPPGKLWVMGDHRSGSSDSRAHLGDPGGGFVPVDKVIGRAFAVIWPLSDRQILQIPATFEQPALSVPASP